MCTTQLATPDNDEGQPDAVQAMQSAMFLWSWTKPPTCACCILVSNTDQWMLAALFPGMLSELLSHENLQITCREQRGVDSRAALSHS